MLERRVDPGDRRARIVYLTVRGRQMARLALREMASIEAEWRAYLDGAGGSGGIVDSISEALAGRASRPMATRTARTRPVVRARDE